MKQFWVGLIAVACVLAASSLHPAFAEDKSPEVIELEKKRDELLLKMKERAESTALSAKEKDAIRRLQEPELAGILTKLKEAQARDAKNGKTGTGTATGIGSTELNPSGGKDPGKVEDPKGSGKTVTTEVGESERMKRKRAKVEGKLTKRETHLKADIAYCEDQMKSLNRKHAEYVSLHGSGTTEVDAGGKGKGTSPGTTELDPNVSTDPGYEGLTRSEIETFMKCHENLEKYRERLGATQKNMNRKKAAIITETGKPYDNKATFTQPLTIPKIEIPKHKISDPFEKRKKQAYAECWAEAKDPVEIIPAIFDPGKSTLSEAQAAKLESDVRDAWKQMQSAGYGRISRIVAVPSSSQIPSPKKANDVLANERAHEGLKAFRGAFRLGTLSDPFVAGYADGVTDSIPRIQGPEWSTQDRALRGKPVSQTDLEQAAAELAKDPNVPVRTVEDLKKCCSKDQYALKYYPYQYVKLRIYPATFQDSPACQQAYENDQKQADQKTAKEVVDPNVANGATAAGATGNAGSAGSVEAGPEGCADDTNCSSSR